MPERRRYVLRSLTDQSDTVWVNKDDLLQLLRGVHALPEVVSAFAELADTIDETTPRVDRSDPLNAWVPPGQAQPCTCQSAPAVPVRGVRAILAAAWNSAWSSWVGQFLRVWVLVSAVLIVVLLCFSVIR